jgi:hypothetical protein
MKLLKIYFAILLFSFLGSMDNQLFAQEEDYVEAGTPSPDDPNEPVKSWSRSWGTNDRLQNGPCSAQIIKSVNNIVRIIIYNNNTKLERQVEIMWDVYGSLVAQTIYQNAGNIEFRSQTMATSVGMNLSREDRKTNPYWKKFKVLNSDVIVGPDAYMKLESDGRFMIYSGKGGVPVVEF